MAALISALLGIGTNVRYQLAVLCEVLRDRFAFQDEAVIFEPFLETCNAQSHRGAQTEALAASFDEKYDLAPNVRVYMRYVRVCVCSSCCLVFVVKFVMLVSFTNLALRAEDARKEPIAAATCTVQSTDCQVQE